MKTDNLREPSFYRKYSPHHEFPLSVVIAVFAHVAVAIFLVIWVLFPKASADEPYAPPKMDTVFLEDGAGFQGLTGAKGAKGGDRAKKEMHKRITNPKKVEKIALKKEIPEVPEIEIKVPTIDPVAVEPEQADEFAKIAKEADDLFRKQAGLPPRNDGGGGDGGQGRKKGPMKGKQVGYGRTPTKQEVYAWRWRFAFMTRPDAAGTAQHLQKLEAIGAVLAVQPANGIFQIIPDLRRRPAETRPVNLRKFEKSVRWYLHKPTSIYALANALKLPFQVRSFAILLPPKHAEKILKAELEIASRNGKTEKDIVQTWFDVELQNGSYVPIVQFQAYSDQTAFGTHPLAEK